MPETLTAGPRECLRIGLVSISDRASSGVYQDQGLPALQAWFGSALTTEWTMANRLIPDERAAIEQALIELVDDEHSPQSCLHIRDPQQETKRQKISG